MWIKSILLSAAALLGAGCVAVPYDDYYGGGYYGDGGYYSSGYYAPAPTYYSGTIVYRDDTRHYAHEHDYRRDRDRHHHDHYRYHEDRDRRTGHGRAWD